MNKPPKGTPWIWLTRDMVASNAWKSLGINARRLIDFLILEWMSHAGKENGKLLAPRHQLEEFGIGARHISAAIDEVDSLGFVDIKRGTGRRASMYALTWLPLHDGTEPTDRWQSVATSQGQSLEMTSQGKHLGYPKGSHKARSDFPREVSIPPDDFPSYSIRREAPSKKDSSLRARGDITDVSTREGPPTARARPARSLRNGRARLHWP
jgi:hypothetical protein